MTGEKSDENSRALALNETVGENCFLARTTPRPVFVFVSPAGQYFSILTGPDQYDVFFRILSELVFCLRYTINKKTSSDRFTCIECNIQSMALRAKWQFMDRSVTHKIVYGPYNILRVTSRSINCHMALSAMNYLLIILGQYFNIKYLPMLLYIFQMR